VALIVVGGGVVWRMTAAETVAPKREVAALRNPVLDELVASTKALANSQQQAIDELQSLQDSVTAQQAEIKRAGDQVAALNGKLETLRQSFANTPAPAPDEKAVEAAPEKTKPAATASKGKRPAARSRSRGHRTVARKPRTVAARK
jgi:uncharacterized coiled-coil protein SlyX